VYRAMWISKNMIVDHKRLTGRLEDGEVELCVFTEVNCVIPSDFSLCRLLTGCYAIMGGYWYFCTCPIANLVARLYLMCSYGARWKSHMGTNFFWFYACRIC